MKRKIFYKPHTDSTGIYPKPLVVPVRGSEGAAGWDLAAAEDVILRRFEPKIIPVNFDIQIPQGHALLVLSRSSNPKRHLLVPNAPGLIDEDYRGAMGVWLMWVAPHNDRDFYKIKEGDRIAQGVLIEYVEQSWERKSELSPTARGRGGPGSTGYSGAPNTSDQFNNSSELGRPKRSSAV